MVFLGFAFLCLFCSVGSPAQRVQPESIQYRLALHLAEDTARVNLLNAMAYSSYSGKLSDVLAFAEQALRLSKKLKYSRGEARAYQMQGIYYSLKNADPVALERFDMALAIFKRIHYKRGICHTLNSIGFYYHMMHKEGEALRYFKLALKNYDPSEGVDLQRTILANLASSSLNNGDYEKGTALATQVVQLSAAARDTDQLASAGSTLAEIAYRQKQYSRSMSLIQGVFALGAYNPKIQAGTRARIRLLAARVNMARKRNDLALPQLQQVVSATEKSDMPEMRSEALHTWFQLDSMNGNYQSALHHYMQARRTDDSLAGDQRSQQLDLFKIKYETEKNILENKALRAEKEHTRKIISQQQGTLVMLAIGFVLIILMVIYLQFANRTILGKNEIIRKQNTNLEHINVVKDKLFSVVSHDLRGPLLQMKGLLNLFQTHDVNDHEMRELTPTVQENLDKTLELVDNLLIWSKNQMQGFTLRPAQFDLGQIVQENVLNFKNQASQKRLVISNEIEPKLIVFADREMINIVLRNLISNAVKFTPDAGTIRIFSKRTERLITISVEDTGIGVKKEVLERIFSFVNYSTPGTLNEKGSGVGLKLCKDFVELNNGKIWIDRKDSPGSVFSFSLPVFHTLN